MFDSTPTAKPPHHVWLETCLFSFVLYLCIGFYVFIEHRYFDLFIADKVLAFTAFILIGFSLVLSSVAYFWDFADDKIMYRKYLGLVGYFLLVIHLIILLYFLRDRFPFPDYYLASQRIIPFIFIGIPAIVIYTMMAAISNHYAIKLLGGKLWRDLLRFGFLAYFYSTLYFSISSYSEWIVWYKTGGGIIPSSFLMLLFGILVLMLRVAMEISHLVKPKAASNA